MDSLKKLKQIYDLIPKINCKRKCHTACGLIDMSDIEKALITERVGHDPFPDYEEMVITLKALGISCLTCPMLTENKECSIYDLRPLVCRLFGVVKQMKCPYGCKPLKYMPNMKAKKLFKKLRNLKP